jgi:hypothetical protein
MEHGKWMKAFIQETKMASSQADGETAIEDEDEEEGTYDDIYDSVDDDNASSASDKGYN